MLDIKIHIYILYIDASGEAAGMILSQGKERVISYAAKKFTEGEKNIVFLSWKL